MKNAGICRYNSKALYKANDMLLNIPFVHLLVELKTLKAMRTQIKNTTRVKSKNLNSAFVFIL